MTSYNSIKKIYGFQLIEILITLFIIGFITIIGIPVYTNHVITAKRLEAEVSLSKLALAIEQYQWPHEIEQKNINLEALKFPKTVAKGSYQLNIKFRDNGYLVMAVPQGWQAVKDRACGILVLYSTGEKSITGSGKIENCW